MTLDLNQPKKTALWQLGFRPFFLSAGLFAVVSVVLWMVLYIGKIQLPLLGQAPTVWHAHEMIFGYAIAVIAGFLLTAVSNWTGVKTIQGGKLAALVALWASARVGFLFAGSSGVLWVALLDTGFLLYLIGAFSAPVLKARQWKQAGLLAKLVLLFLANGAFYLGAAGMLPDGIHWGLYSGLYFILGVVFVMARRVMPFFIQNGIDASGVQLRNWKWLDISSLVLFTAFWFFDTFLRGSVAIIGLLAAILFVLHTIRLWGWHHADIWKKPLLWSLYLGYGFIVVGFALKAAVWLFGISPFLSLHAFAYGGIGVITIGMMSRVSLGHTGRNVFDPPKILWLPFSLLFVGALIRVIVPLFSDQYLLWVLVAQVLWVVSFSIFVYLFAPALIQPRVDGKPG